MFGENLSNQLLQYLRRLWPFIIAVIGTGVLAYFIVKIDTNPYEMTGTLSGIALFIMASLAFVISGLVCTFLSFKESLHSIEIEDMQSFKQFYWSQLVAFIIYIVFAAFLIFAGVYAFASDAVGKMLSSFSTEWPYFIEFVFYFIIVIFTVFFIPSTWITLFYFKGQIKVPVKRSLAAGIFTLWLCFGSIMMEIFLLAGHNSLTLNTPSLLATLITFLVFFTFIDIRAYLLMRRTFRNVLYDT